MVFPIRTNASQKTPVHVTAGKVAGAHRHIPLPVTTHWDVASVVTRSLLDHVHQRLLDTPDDLNNAMDDLMAGLCSLKTSTTPVAWQDVLRQCADHPLRELIHQDPFSHRSFHKPRGYAGDAVLIDYIYSRNCRLSETDEVSEMGERVFRYNRDTPACAAVRSRRDLIASIIDEMCALNDRPNILSVACGHLREAKLCRSVMQGQTGRFVALDQDELSLNVVEQEVSGYGVVPVCSSIKSLYRGEIAREKFDFIYSTGLYDYLDDRTAVKLTARAFEMLKPGGRLLVANFLTDIIGAGYMEAFMDWKLTYRTREQLTAVAAGIPTAEIANMRAFNEKNSNIVFLDLIRA